MLTRIISETKIKALRKYLERSDKVVITTHICPDGDAMGSSLGFARVLEALGKDVKVITPDQPPKNLMWLPGAKDIVVFTRYEDFAAQLIADADLIFSLDYNDIKRIDRLGEAVQKAEGWKVMIDHHLDPGDFANVVISHPEQSSTSVLVFRVLCRLEQFANIDKSAATCIYTGMMTDTGNFSYNSNDPDLYIVVAELIRKGINKDEIYSRVFNCNSVSRLRLNGYALDHKLSVWPEHRAALIVLTRDELNHYQYQKGDTESLVNQPLTVPEIVYSFFIREEKDYVKVSARSKGDFPVNQICEKYYNGGGHLNAAGGEFHGSLDEAVKIFEELMPLYDNILPNSSKK